MIENLSVESWEQLAANASQQHEQNLATRNNLQRQRASSSLAGMMSGELDATAAIDEQLASLEARIVGHQQTMKLIRVGLDAATVIACADADLIKISETRTSAQRRAELAHLVDDALQQLATVVSAYLDSKESTASPARVGGDLNRAFWAAFAGTRNRPTWARRAVADMSANPHSMATARPLGSTVDPVLAESDALEQAALKRKQEALETLKALTLTKPLTPAKSRANRKIEALEIAA